jgi:succinyl-CoA synthetase alpha subunit
MIEMPSFRLGYLGGESPFTSLAEGGLAILSTSGGMTNEIVMACGRRRIGVRAVMSLGGDRVAGTTLAEAIARMETREDVKAIAIFVEPGNPWLREAAAPTKPTAVMLPGNALESLPRGLPYGHTGTILGEDEPRLVDVRSRIVAQGMKCTDRLSEFLDSCESL